MGTVGRAGREPGRRPLLFFSASWPAAEYDRNCPDLYSLKTWSGCAVGPFIKRTRENGCMFSIACYTSSSRMSFKLFAPARAQRAVFSELGSAVGRQWCSQYRRLDL